MATSITWYGQQGETATEIPSGTGLAFFGLSAGSPMAVGSWNSGTYIATVSGSYTIGLNNTQSGSAALPIVASGVPLKVLVGLDIATALTNAYLYAYDASTGSPEGMTLLAAEAAVSTAWAPVGGTAGLLMAAKDTAATYTYYIALTASPTSIGEHIGNRMVFSVTYGALSA